MKNVLYSWFAVIICIYSSLQLSAQEFSEKNILSDFTTCCAINDSCYYVGGLYGALLQSTDYGNSWNSIHIPYTITHIKTLDFFDNNQGILGDVNGNIALTFDGGKEWAVQKIGDSTIHAVQWLNAQSIIVLSANGKLYYTENSGNTWNTVFSISGLHCNTFYTTNDAWYILADKGKIFRSSNNGKAWDTVISGPDYAQFLSMSFINDNDGIAIGYTATMDFDSKPVVIMQTKDNGNTWQKSPIADAIKQYYYSTAAKIIYRKDSNNAFILLSSKFIARTTDAGNSWKLDTIKFSNVYKGKFHVTFGYSNRGLDITKNGYGLVVGTYHGILTTTDYGLTWRERSYAALSSSSGSRFIYHIARQNGTTLFMAGERVGLFESHNNGQTWLYRYPNKDTIGNGTGSNLTYIHFSSPSHGFAVGELFASPASLKRIILHTQDGGKTWWNRGTIFASIGHFISPQTGFLIGDSTLYKTTDGGNTWSQKQLPNNNYSKLHFFTEDEGIVLSVKVGVPTKDTINFPFKSKTVFSVLRTKDGFQSWDTLYTEARPDRSVSSMKWIDKSTGFILAGNQILRTIDGGNKWDVIHNSSIKTLRNIDFFHEKVGIALGNNDTILITTDGGTTWNKQYIFVAPHYYSYMNDFKLSYSRIFIIDDSLAFLSGNHRLMRIILPKALRKVQTGIAEGGSYHPNLYIKVLPHPSRGASQLHLYGLYVDKAVVPKLRIYNIFGSMVADISQQAAMSSNGSLSTIPVPDSLPTGVYIAEMIVGKYSTSVSFIVEH